MSERLTERLTELFRQIEQQATRKNRASNDPFLLEADLDIIFEKCKSARMILKEVEQLEAVFDVHTD